MEPKREYNNNDAIKKSAKSQINNLKFENNDIKNEKKVNLGM